jgi:hypothetical protein
MSGTPDAGLQARLRAAHLEITHLGGIVTHPATRTELARIEEMLRRHDLSTSSPEEIEASLEQARHRLRTIHNAVAESGAGVAVRLRA